jgi:hypothetical protein
MKMTPDNLIANHGNVVGYVSAVAAELTRFAEQAEPPAGFPAALTEEVRACARAAAEVLRTAAEVLADPPVIMTALAAQLRAQAEPAADEPEIHLTTRKVAQA